MPNADPRPAAVSSAASRPFWLVVIALAGAGLILLLLAPRSSEKRGAAHAAVGAKVEQLQLQPLTEQGTPLAASDLQGKVTLLNFWGPWCPPCQIEFPHLVELHEHFRSKGDFQLVSVSCSGGPGDDADMLPSTTEFLKQLKAGFPAYRDAGGLTRDHLSEAACLEGFAYPTTVVLDRERVIRGLWIGYVRGDETAMQQVIDEVLRKP